MIAMNAYSARAFMAFLFYDKTVHIFWRRKSHDVCESVGKYFREVIL